MQKRTVFNLVLFILIALMGMNTMHAQSTEVAATKDNNEKWTIGIGLNVIYDAGKLTSANFFNSKYNQFGFPLIMTVEYAPTSKFAFIGSASFNKYKSGKIADNYEIQEGDEPFYFGLDLGARLYIGDILNFGRLDPFAQIGFGYNRISSYADRSTSSSLKLKAQMGTN